MKINWSRLTIGALIVTTICFFTDGFIHEQVLGTDWDNVYRGLGASEPPHQTSALAYFVIFEIGRGVLSMLLYVTMRTFFGAGPKTAVLAAIAAWFAFSVTAPAQFIPLQFFSTSLWIKAAGLQLITSIIATIAGAALYKDPVEIATA